MIYKKNITTKILQIFLIITPILTYSSFGLEWGPESTDLEFEQLSEQATPAPLIISKNFPTVTSWLESIYKLPQNRHGADASLHSGFTTCGNKEAQWQEFKSYLDAWLDMMSHGPLTIDRNWSISFQQKIKPDASFFNTSSRIATFQPFAQKIIVPANSIIYARGDLHGDIYSLADQIDRLLDEGVIDESFKIIKPNHWIIFLGDYVDRGQYGCEVIYTILRLAVANPDKVIAVRGNHEETNMNTRDGFGNEVNAKFNDTTGSIFAEINRMYDFLPAVLYLGCKDNRSITNYAQCCHGGLEIGYNPQAFLDHSTTKYQQIDHLLNFNNLVKLQSHMNRKKLPSQKDYSQDIKAIQDLSENITPLSTQDLGLLWNDFDVNNRSQIQLNTQRGIGQIYGQHSTQDILALQSSDHSKIRWIFRAHQHSCDSHDPMMQGLIQSNGVYKLWNPYEKEQTRYLREGLVWTLNVGADSVYGEFAGFNFDTYIAIQPQQDPNEWTIQLFMQETISAQAHQSTIPLREDTQGITPRLQQDTASFEDLNDFKFD